MPTLGEIAAYQQSLLSGIPDPSKAVAQVSAWADIARKKNALEKEEFELAQQKENEASNVLGGSLRDPAWNSGDPYQILGTTQRVREQLQARGIPLTKGSMLDQIEERLWGAAQSGDPQEAGRVAQESRRILEDSLLQGAGTQNRYNETRQTLGTSGGQPGGYQSGGIGAGGGGVSINPVKINQPGAAPGSQGSPGLPPGQRPPPEGSTGGYNAPGMAGSPNVPNAPGNAPGASNLPYVNRRPGDLTPYAVGEQEDFKIGQQIKSDVLANQDALAKRIYNNQVGYESINRISNGRIFQTGLPGRAEKSFDENLRQNQDYARFTKAQANSLINTRGGATGAFAQTDAGRQILQIAQGAEAPPAVAREIMLQNFGDDAKDKMLNQLINNYSTITGNANPANLPALQNQFNSLGSDFRVFQLMGVQSSKLSKEEKVAAAKIILHGASKEDAQSIIANEARLQQFIRTGR